MPSGSHKIRMRECARQNSKQAQHCKIYQRTSNIFIVFIDLKDFICIFYDIIVISVLLVSK